MKKKWTSYEASRDCLDLREFDSEEEMIENEMMEEED